MKPVRIGVVGLGNFGRLHALTLANLTEAELVGLVDPQQKSLDAPDDISQAHAVSGRTSESYLMSANRPIASRLHLSFESAMRLP